LENEKEETDRKDGRPENAKEISDSNREMEEASSDEEKKMLIERRKRVATSARKNSAKKSKKFTASDEEEQEELEKDEEEEEHENRRRSQRMGWKSVKWLSFSEDTADSVIEEFDGKEKAGLKKGKSKKAQKPEDGQRECEGANEEENVREEKTGKKDSSAGRKKKGVTKSKKRTPKKREKDEEIPESETGTGSPELSEAEDGSFSRLLYLRKSMKGKEKSAAPNMGQKRMAKDAKNREEDGAAEGENSGSADKQKTRHENACPNCDKIFISTDQRNMHVYKA